MADKEFKPNPGQEAVFTHKGGPLLIVAGAGTGKTRTITEKISMLLEEGVKPAEILAVTFTEKAAAEMSDRILLNREGLLLDLPIMTYNGYGDSILREYGLDIGLSHNFRLLTPQAQIVFVRERIDEFKLDYFLPLSTIPDSIIEDILRFFSRLKQHIVTPDVYQKFANNLPAGDDAEHFDKQKHQELAAAYATYIHLMRAENSIDYDDQIYLTIQLLESRPNVRKTLQDRYHTIFVDEFQDTNPMQSRLIDLIVPASRNLIVVGDDDQAIYGFRGATIQNILDFKERYPDAADATLTINYRSHQAILDAAYSLISKNNPDRLETRLGLNKRLTSSESGQEPQLRRFADPSQELDWLARDIQERLKEQKDGVSIAVLTRSNNGAQKVHQALDGLNIPHRVIGLNPDLYTRTIVRTLLELTRTIVEPDNSTSLHHTLISDLFGLSNDLIAPYATQARREHESLLDMLKEVPEAKNALEILRSLQADAASESVGRLLWRAITDTGYKARLLDEAANSEVAAAAIGHLSQFFDTLKDFEAVAMQPTAVQYLLALPALKAAGETTDDTLAINEDEVIVTTVHKAKGLEWDTVYLPRLTEQSFPMYRQGGGIALPDELRRDHPTGADEHYAEERRVMYVAITRARQNLLLSWSDGNRKPSRFLTEMFGAQAIENTSLTESDGTSVQLTIAVEQLPIKAIPRSIYDGKTVRLDVSKAQALLNCPLNFYYKFVLGAPEEPKAATTYGTYMHAFIQEINELCCGHKPLRPLDAMLQSLEQGWQKSGYASKSQRERAFEQAKQTLASYYKQAASGFAPIAVEQDFEARLSDDLVLYGRIDAVFQTDKGIEIRDFKTGYAARDEADAKKKASSSRQLELYALAWYLGKGELPAQLSLHYVDAGVIGSTSKKLPTLEKRQLELIRVVENMKQGGFPPGSRHDYCIHPPLAEV